MLFDPAVPMDNQDLFTKLGESTNDLSTTLLGDDPFNDSTGDVFDKFLADDFDRSNRSGGLPDSALLMSSANEAAFQEMLDSSVRRGNVNGNFMVLEPNSSKNADYRGMGADVQRSGGFGYQDGSNAKNWFQRTDSIMTAPISQTDAQGNLLDAAPLNISLGRAPGIGAFDDGFDSGHGGLVGADFSGGDLGGGVGNESSSSIASMLRRKGSNAQLHGSKMNSARKVGLTSSKLRNTKSEGMLARALKAKYNNSGNSLNKYNINEAEASAVINARFPTSASALAAGQRLSQTSFIGGNDDGISISQKDGSGKKNATWGSGSSLKGGASLFANVLSGPEGTNHLDGPPLTSNNSMSELIRQQKLSSGGSRTSMQELLRLSKKQSKTQSALRQSSAQSLLKQSSSQSLKESKKIDVSSLLPPSHAFKGLSISSTPSPKLSSNTNQNMPFNSMQSSNMESASLLHQSCRLYPRTAAVVESALRIDPEAVRKAVPVTLEKGQKKQNVFGYPVNVAMAYGGSLEVIKMLIEAGPEVLVEKDGNDGAGSLAIALISNIDRRVVDLMIQANPECVKVSDRRGNYPLHVAVSHGCTIQLVKRLHAIHPKALQMRNFHSQTPLDIAQRSTRCSEEVMNYLQSMAYLPMEHNAYHLDKHNQGDLEDGLDDIMETNL